MDNYYFEPVLFIINFILIGFAIVPVTLRHMKRILREERAKQARIDARRELQ